MLSEDELARYVWYVTWYLRCSCCSETQHTHIHFRSLYHLSTLDVTQCTRPSAFFVQLKAACRHGKEATSDISLLISSTSLPISTVLRAATGDCDPVYGGCSCGMDVAYYITPHTTRVMQSQWHFATVTGSPACSLAARSQAVIPITALQDYHGS